MEDTQKFKCLVLYTAQTGIAKQKVEQDHLFRLLQSARVLCCTFNIRSPGKPPSPGSAAHRIGYDVVDGATASNKELRTKSVRRSLPCLGRPTSAKRRGACCRALSPRLRRLFDLAGKGVLYPLVFFRSSSDPGEFTFVGDFASIYVRVQGSIATVSAACDWRRPPPRAEME